MLVWIPVRLGCNGVQKPHRKLLLTNKDDEEKHQCNGDEQIELVKEEDCAPLCTNCQMYLSNLQNVFVQSANYICPNTMLNKSKRKMKCQIVSLET